MIYLQRCFPPVITQVPGSHGSQRPPGQRSGDLRQGGRRTWREGARPWEELMFKSRPPPRSWHPDKYADPSAIDRAGPRAPEMLWTPSRGPRRASYWTVQLQGYHQSKLKWKRVCMEDTVGFCFFWQKSKVFFFLVRGGTSQRRRQELRVHLQGLPARMCFKSHDWKCILTV